MVNQFRNNTKLTEFIATRDTPAGAALVLARPLKVGNVSVKISVATNAGTDCG